MSIIGILIGMTLPAVQQVREAARRVSCANNLKQSGLALLNFESSLQRIPEGATFDTGLSWSAQVLPFLELGNLHDQIDFDRAYDSAINQTALEKKLAVFTCPSSWKTYPGFTDYCGISGSWLSATNSMGSRNGVLFPAAAGAGVRLEQIRDGLSNTIAIAEGVAVTERNYGFWGCGLHCFSHDDGPVNNRNGGFKEIASSHPSGAQVVFCDGSVQFLSAEVAGSIVGALCTRAEQEIAVNF